MTFTGLWKQNDSLYHLTDRGDGKVLVEMLKGMPLGDSDLQSVMPTVGRTLSVSKYLGNQIYEVSEGLVTIDTGTKTIRVYAPVKNGKSQVTIQELYSAIRELMEEPENLLLERPVSRATPDIIILNEGHKLQFMEHNVELKGPGQLHKHFEPVGGELEVHLLYSPDGTYGYNPKRDATGIKLETT